MTEKPELIRPTDDQARTLARTLARGARFAAIAVIDPESGAPLSSRVLVATDIDATPVILISRLAQHTQALLADPRCSLLLGEPQKGDPLAWPRLSLQGRAVRVESDSESHSCVRRRFLRRHPKAKLYADFPDFAFFRIMPESASLNGGFGKAYKISAEDLIIRSNLTPILLSHELQVIANICALGENVPNQLARHFFKGKTGDWEISGLDAEGMELAQNESLIRIETEKRPEDLNGLIAVYSELLT